MIRRPISLLAALGLCASGCDATTLSGLDGADAGPVRPAEDPSAPLFAPDHIVEVDIRLAPADWDLLRAQARTFTEILSNCLSGPFSDPFTWFRGSVTIDGQRLDDVGVRKKGFLGSLDPVRPGIKLKFDEYVDGRRFAGLKNFTLNNSKQDPALIRQCLSYLTFRAAGVPATRCNFAHVKVNGVDLGVYVHVESAGKDLLERHYTDASGNLYEGTLSDFRDGWTATFELKTNSTANNRADLAPVVEALKASDADLLSRLDPVLHVDRFLTFWATEALIGHWDGYSGNANNFYVYHDPGTGRFDFLPWGADGTFPRSPRPGALASVMAVSLLPRRLYQLPATRDRYVARLRQLLGTAWNEAALGAEIDRMQRLITPIADPDGRFGLADQIDGVRRFVSGRRAEVEAELAKGPPAWTAPLRGAPCLAPIGTVSGSITTTWGTSKVADPLGTGRGTLTGTINGVPIQIVRAGAIAGLDPNAMPPESAFVQLAVVAQLRDNTIQVAVFHMAPGRYRPNTTLKIDFSTVNGGVYRLNPMSMKFEAVGGISDGTLALEMAGNTPGAAVTATFSGTVTKPFQ